MIAVADASPLGYLVLIGEIDLLRQLFSRVLVPHAVIPELLHADAPAAVRKWESTLPGWISVEQTPKLISPGMEKLQAGERAAIHLAESIKSDLVIINEKAVRLVVANRGLSVTGILGVVGEAATRGLVDLAGAIDKLRRTTFRCSPALFKATLDRYGARPA